MEAAITAFHDALSSINAPRYFESERGFQGALLVQLSHSLTLPDKVLIEQEHQKRLQAHGLTFRPDIIVHEPFTPLLHGNRSEGNYIVVELKLNATPEEATDDFRKLTQMLQILNYPIGIFINIGSTRTYRELAPIETQGRVVCFAVSQSNGETIVIEERA